MVVDTASTAWRSAVIHFLSSLTAPSIPVSLSLLLQALCRPTANDHLPHSRNHSGPGQCARKRNISATPGVPTSRHLSVCNGSVLFRSSNEYMRVPLRMSRMTSFFAQCAVPFPMSSHCQEFQLPPTSPQAEPTRSRKAGETATPTPRRMSSTFPCQTCSASPLARVPAGRPRARTAPSFTTWALASGQQKQPGPSTERKHCGRI